MRVIKPGDFVILTGSKRKNLPDGIYRTRNVKNHRGYLSIKGWLYRDNGEYCGTNKLLQNSIITFDSDINEMSELLSIMFIK